MNKKITPTQMFGRQFPREHKNHARNFHSSNSLTSINISNGRHKSFDSYAAATIPSSLWMPGATPGCDPNLTECMVIPDNDPQMNESHPNALSHLNAPSISLQSGMPHYYFPTTYIPLVKPTLSEASGVASVIQRHSYCSESSSNHSSSITLEKSITPSSSTGSIIEASDNVTSAEHQKVNLNADNVTGSQKEAQILNSFPNETKNSPPKKTMFHPSVNRIIAQHEESNFQNDFNDVDWIQGKQYSPFHCCLPNWNDRANIDFNTQSQEGQISHPSAVVLSCDKFAASPNTIRPLTSPSFVYPRTQCFSYDFPVLSKGTNPPASCQTPVSSMCSQHTSLGSPSGAVCVLGEMSPTSQKPFQFVQNQSLNQNQAKLVFSSSQSSSPLQYIPMLQPSNNGGIASCGCSHINVTMAQSTLSTPIGMSPTLSTARSLTPRINTPRTPVCSIIGGALTPHPSSASSLTPDHYDDFNFGDLKPSFSGSLTGLHESQNQSIVSPVYTLSLMQSHPTASPLETTEVTSSSYLCSTAPSLEQGIHSSPQNSQKALTQPAAISLKPVMPHTQFRMYTGVNPSDPQSTAMFEFTSQIPSYLSPMCETKPLHTYPTPLSAETHLLMANPQPQQNHSTFNSNTKQHSGHHNPKPAQNNKLNSAKEVVYNAQKYLGPGELLPDLDSNGQPRRKSEVRLFVGRIPKWYTNKYLKALFDSFGDVLGCNIIRDRRAAQSQGCGFVHFQYVDEARKAIEVLNQTLWLDPDLGPLQVKFAKGELERLGLPLDLQPGGECAKVFFGNLAANTTEEELWKVFQSFGPFEDLCILRDTKKNSKCSGFITFTSMENAEAAIDALDGKFFVTGAIRPLEVRFAMSRNTKSGVKV